MKSLSNQPVSLAEFARRMDCDESTVRRYVKEGRICAPAVAYKPTGKVAGLFFAPAKAQYSEARALVEFRFARSGGAPTGKAGRNAPGGRPTPTGPGREGRPFGRLSEAELNDLDLNELAKLESVLRVRKAWLDLTEKEARLVDKEQVLQALFAAGQEICNRMEAVPDRIVDDVLAAPNRNEAFVVLRREINAALSELAGMGGSQ